jgi:hypothetical protein
MSAHPSPTCNLSGAAAWDVMVAEAAAPAAAVEAATTAAAATGATGATAAAAPVLGLAAAAGGAAVVATVGYGPAGAGFGLANESASESKNIQHAREGLLVDPPAVSRYDHYKRDQYDTAGKRGLKPPSFLYDTMKKYPAGLLAVIALALSTASSSATTLLSLPITTAIGTTRTAPIETKDWPPENLTVHCNFVYGSGGETVDAYVQMSVDGGSTWVDVAECHFTMTSLRELYDISSLPSAVSSRTATGGMISWRAEYVSTGTYAGGTTLQIDLQGGRSQTQP